MALPMRPWVNSGVVARTTTTIPVRMMAALTCVALSGCNCEDNLGVLNASVTVEPTMIDFGRVPVNSQKTVKLKIKNRGSFVAQVMDFVADAPFVAPTVTATVGTFTEIEVDVAMRPTAVGMTSGTLMFTTNDPDAISIMVPLVGEGIEAAVTVAPPIVDFGEVLWDINTVPPTIEVTVSNPGTDAFDLTNFTLVENGGAAFTTDPMGIEQTFAPGSSSTFTVTYTPNAMGAVTGFVRFDTTTAAAPQIEVPIMGTAVGPELEVCAAATGATELCTAAGEVPSVLMLNVDRNATASGSVRVLNAGNRDLTVFGAQFIRMEDEFTYAPDPAAAGQFVLTPNEERAFNVTYTPADYEFDLETLIVATDSATRPTSSVLIRGEVGRPQIRVDPSTATFQQNGPASPARTSVALANCGSLPLMVNGALNLRVTSGGPAFTLENTPGGGTTLPMEDCNAQPVRALTFDVVFDPPGDGTFEAEIDVMTNDPITPTFVIMLSGVRR